MSDENVAVAKKVRKAKPKLAKKRKVRKVLREAKKAKPVKKRKYTRRAPIAKKRKYTKRAVVEAPVLTFAELTDMVEVLTAATARLTDTVFGAPKRRGRKPA